MREFLVSSNNAQAVLNTVWAFIVEALAGGAIIIRIMRPSKSRLQERHYHALIGEIASQVNVLGKKYKAEIWKALLVDQFEQDKKELGETLRYPSETVPAMDMSGRLVTVRASTTGFTVSEASEFIEFLYAKGVELGIVWSANAEQLKQAAELGYA